MTHYVRSEPANATININGCIVTCDVAITPRQQMSGLQAYPSLDKDRGLWFPQNRKRIASFHMGEVKYPIDIIYVNDNVIVKIAHNMKPGAFGSVSHLCTDVIEVNGNWCKKNNVKIGDKVTFTVSKSAQKSYDLLRTITEADKKDQFEDELRTLFPNSFDKLAQENRQIKPFTYREQPGEVDLRNPAERFKGNDLPDVGSPEGQDNPDGVMGGEVGLNPANINYQYGYDPATFREEDNEFALRSSQKVTVDGPQDPFNGIDRIKLAKTSVSLFDKYPPQWSDEEADNGHSKVALITDELISSWIDSLGWTGEPENKLRQIAFTDTYKLLLGDALVASGKIASYQKMDSDLILNK